MTIPHITIEQAKIMFSAVEANMKLANELIDKANAEQSAQQALTALPENLLPPESKKALGDWIDSEQEYIEITAEEARKLQRQTKDTHDWLFPNDLDIGMHFEPAFKAEGTYTYAPKATIKLDGKMVTPEQAAAEWESKKETHEVWYRTGNSVWITGFGERFSVTCDGVQVEYELRPKQLKQVSWSDMPVGVMTNKGKLRNVFGIKAITETPEKSKHGYTSLEHLTCTLKLAPASEQPWMYWGGGECPVPEGCTFDVTLRFGNKYNSYDVSKPQDAETWKHTGLQHDIIAYRITGLADGWKMEGAV